jgi:hypothetical protein
MRSGNVILIILDFFIFVKEGVILVPGDVEDEAPEIPRCPLWLRGLQLGELKCKGWRRRPSLKL